MNTKLHVQKYKQVHPVIKKKNLRRFPKKNSKPVNTMKYLKNEANTVISDSSLMMVSVDIVTI